MDFSRTAMRKVVATWRLTIWATILLAYVVFVFAFIALKPESFQITLYTYYYGALAFGRGLDPYDAKDLYGIAAQPFVLPYVYPPLTLHLFTPLTWLSFRAAYWAFLGVKALGVAALFWLWAVKFAKRIDATLCLVCILGFNGALYWDVSVGNISLFLQLLLWFGFYLYVQGHFRGFACAVGVASVFKLLPIVFLLLLWPLERRQRWRALCWGGGVFAGILLCSCLLYPELTAKFVTSMTRATGVVAINSTTSLAKYGDLPALWPLVKVLTMPLANHLPKALGAGIGVLSFTGIAGLVLWMSRAALARYVAASAYDQRLFLVNLACLLYLMLSPRLMLYDYVLGLYPIYYVFRKLPVLPPGLLLLALIAVATNPARPPVLNRLITTLAEFYPLLVAYVVWGLLLRYLPGAQRDAPA